MAPGQHLSPERRAHLHAMLLEGKTPSEICRALGCSHNTVVRMRNLLEDNGGFLPDERSRPEPREPDQFTAYVALHGTSRPAVRVRVKQVRSDAPRQVGPALRVVVIADTHDCPGLTKERFSWIGNYIAQTKPDRVVHLGDFSDFDSFSRHEPWHSLNGRERPPFAEDLDSMEEALALLSEPIMAMERPPTCAITFGNHEERAWIWENDHPEMAGSVWSRIEDIFERFHWATFPYREWLFIEGVGFTHAPHNAAGRPYMGKFPENSMANDASFSVVFGHTHKSVYRTAPKLGPANRITVFNPGCALPYGMVKRYAQMNITGWTWGIGDITIQDGNIVGHAIIPMAELERRYG